MDRGYQAGVSSSTMRHRILLDNGINEDSLKRLCVGSDPSVIRRSHMMSMLGGGSRLVGLDRQNGYIHKLNQSASFVWEQCDGESTLEEIAKRMTEAFEIDFRTSISDCTETDSTTQ